MKEEIDRFRFEEEEDLTPGPAQSLVPESETGDRSSVHAPAAVVTCLDSTSEEEMASNQMGKGLKELLAGRAKEGTLKETPKSKVPHSLPPPPPPPPVDLGLKANPDLKKKRPIVNLEEGEIGQQKGAKQQKTAKEPGDRRSSSVDSREDQNRADVCIASRIWSSRLEVDGTAITWDASVREYRKGQVAHVVEALEQPFLLPKDIEVVRNLKQQPLLVLEEGPGHGEPQARLAEELAEAYREFYDATLDATLNAVKVPADSTLRRPENVYYHPHIRAVTDDPLSEAPDAAKAIEAEVKDVNSMVPDATAKTKEMEAEAKGGELRAKDASITQPSQKEDPPVPEA
ncbi:hypothetical protein SO802_009850 [Lithocarpus litseifolius]|uniref:Uncharacterized protein n=1 Tax=Lithocarpus litseifolius TaxID=425828 RepID=A0AAW2DFH9_9ROSI